MPSLLEYALEDFCFVDKSHVDDGYGGFISSFKDGAVFKADANFFTSSNSVIADKMTDSRNCTITTLKNVELQPYDIVKRLSDKCVFRVLSVGKDTETPKTAALNMRQVKAEVWVIPDE